MSANGKNTGGLLRVRLCAKEPWCLEDEGHQGPCVVKPRGEYQRPAWDRGTPDPSGWRGKK